MKIYKLSTKQKVAASALLALAAVVGVLLGANTKVPVATPAPMVDSATDPHTVARVNMQAIAVLGEADKALAAAQKAIAKSEAKSPASPEDAPFEGREMWSTGNLKAANPTIPLNPKISAYTIVEVDAHPATFPAVGDDVAMPMLNGEKVVMEVQSVTTSPNGDFSWAGHLKGHDDDYPVTMTYGAHSTFATITTPQGSYTMESVNGVGWLYKNPAEAELTAPGVNDFLEPNFTK